jgi:hypothetical protein
MDTKTNPKSHLNSNSYVPIKEKPCYCCHCYTKDSFDSRCCGACYYCCPIKDKEKQCHYCPNTFSEYWYSGYVQTSAGYGTQSEDINGVCCWFCFLPKLSLFWPCLFGSTCNSCINSIRNTNTNYLV